MTRADERIPLHVYIFNRFTDFRREHETSNQAVKRLLPYNGEVMGTSRHARRDIYITPDVRHELSETAGPTFGQGDVIDQYLTEAGYPRRPEDIREQSWELQLGAGQQ